MKTKTLQTLANELEASLKRLQEAREDVKVSVENVVRVRMLMNEGKPMSTILKDKGFNALSYYAELSENKQNGN